MNELLQTVVTDAAGQATARNYGLKNSVLFTKTGTTTEDKDRWFVGGTPYYVAAVWYGYDIPESIYTWGNPAGAVHKTVFDAIHEDLPDKEFEDLDGAVEKTYCTYTGKLASSSCYSTATGWYKKDNVPDYCTGHYYSPSDDDEDKDDEEKTTKAEAPATSAPAQPDNDTDDGADTDD